MPQPESDTCKTPSTTPQRSPKTLHCNGFDQPSNKYRRKSSQPKTQIALITSLAKVTKSRLRRSLNSLTKPLGVNTSATLGVDAERSRSVNRALLELYRVG